MKTNTLQRHPQNINVHLLYADQFRGLPLSLERGPYILQYLERSCGLLQKAFDAHSQLYVLCFDMRYPALPVLPEQAYESGTASSFWIEFNRKIKRDAVVQGHETFVLLLFVNG